MLYNNYKE